MDTPAHLNYQVDFEWSKQCNELSCISSIYLIVASINLYLFYFTDYAYLAVPPVSLISQCCHQNKTIAMHTILSLQQCHHLVVIILPQWLMLPLNQNTSNRTKQLCYSQSKWIYLNTDIKKPRSYPKQPNNMLKRHKIWDMSCWVDISSMLAISFGHESKLWQQENLWPMWGDITTYFDLVDWGEDSWCQELLEICLLILSI